MEADTSSLNASMRSYCWKIISFLLCPEDHMNLIFTYHFSTCPKYISKCQGPSNTGQVIVSFTENQDKLLFLFLMGRFFKPPLFQHWGFSTTIRNNSITSNLFWINQVNRFRSSLCFSNLNLVSTNTLRANCWESASYMWSWHSKQLLNLWSSGLSQIHKHFFLIQQLYNML